MTRAVLTYVLTLGSALAIAFLAFGQWRAPATTTQPSLINCFSYLNPTEANFLYPAMIVLAAMIMMATLFYRRIAAHLCDGMILLIWGYLLLIGYRTTSLGVAGTGVPEALFIVAFVVGFVFFAAGYLLRKLPGGRE